MPESYSPWASSAWVELGKHSRGEGLGENKQTINGSAQDVTVTAVSRGLVGPFTALEGKEGLYEEGDFGM